MKKIAITLFVMLFAGSISAYAEWSFGYNSKTGDASLDASLEKLNVRVKANQDGFVEDLSVRYGVSKPEVKVLIDKWNMPPGDMYMTTKLSRLCRRPIDDVARVYRANKNKGWGQIAKQLGIKPGSREFHQLKQDDTHLLGSGTGQGNQAGQGNKRGKGKGKKK